MLASPPENATCRPTWRRDLLALIGLLAVVLVTQGGSLNDGVFLDDHWQRAASRDLGWSFHDLIESATIDFSGRWNRFWWQDRPLIWRYARPVGMLIVKLEYRLTGGDPVAIHAIGLGWHILTGWLVYRLALWAGLGIGWALLAGVFFVIHPHSTIAVGWTSARNAVVSGCFFAAALLLYALASIGPRAPTVNQAQAAPPLRGFMFGCAILLWILSLLSREAAIVFPGAVVFLDLAYGGWIHLRRRLGVYALLAIIAGAFLYWRLFAFSVAAVPDVYFIRPQGLDYLLWAGSKLLNLLFAQVFHTPMVMGVATKGQWSAAAIWAHVAMVILLAGIAAWYIAATRGRRDRWLWPACTALAFLPVLPVFTAPHFAYLPAIPYAIALTLMCRGIVQRWRPMVTVLVVAATLWSIGVYRVALRGIVRAEQLVYADVDSTTPPATPGTRVFFINLPIVATYASGVLADHWRVPDIRGYTLTLATHPLMMDRPSTVEVVDDRTIVVSTPPPGYFAGFIGHMFLRVMRKESALPPGAVIHGEEFDAEVLAADAAGIQKLKFIFRRPINSKQYIFYYCTPDRPARRLRFDSPLSTPFVVPATTDSDLAWQQDHAPMLRDRSRFFTIMNIIARVIRSDLYLTGGADAK